MNRSIQHILWLSVIVKNVGYLDTFYCTMCVCILEQFLPLRCAQKQQILNVYY